MYIGNRAKMTSKCVTPFFPPRKLSSTVTVVTVRSLHQPSLFWFFLVFTVELPYIIMMGESCFDVIA